MKVIEVKMSLDEQIASAHSQGKLGVIIQGSGGLQNALSAWKRKHGKVKARTWEAVSVRYKKDKRVILFVDHIIDYIFKHDKKEQK